MDPPPAGWRRLWHRAIPPRCTAAWGPFLRPSALRWRCSCQHGTRSARPAPGGAEGRTSNLRCLEGAMTPRTQRQPPTVLWELSANQHGVVTRRQLMAAGLSSDAVRHRLARGRLHRLRRGVYAVGRPQVSREGAWLAATLSCGPGAALSHSSAAALWGIREPAPAAPIELTVPPAGVRPRRGLRLHRAALDPGDLTVRRGVPVVRPAVVMLGQATALSARRLERDINVADALGLIGADQLRAAAERFSGRPGVVALRAVLDRHTFTLTDSELER